MMTKVEVEGLVASSTLFKNGPDQESRTSRTPRQSLSIKGTLAMESDLKMGFGITLQAKYVYLPILRFQLVAGLFREVCSSLSFACFFGDSCVLFLRLNLLTFFFVVDLGRLAFLGLFFSTGASRHRQDCNYCGSFFSFHVVFLVFSNSSQRYLMSERSG
jgi:hypothetical protein